MLLRKASKKHCCVLCDNEIETNTNYVYSRITPWDHEVNEYFFDYKAHIECDIYWQRYGGEYDWELPDYFIPNIIEEVGLLDEKDIVSRIYELKRRTK